LYLHVLFPPSSVRVISTSLYPSTYLIMSSTIWIYYLANLLIWTSNTNKETKQSKQGKRKKNLYFWRLSSFTVLSLSAISFSVSLVFLIWSSLPWDLSDFELLSTSTHESRESSVYFNMWSFKKKKKTTKAWVETYCSFTSQFHQNLKTSHLYVWLFFLFCIHMMWS